MPSTGVSCHPRTPTNPNLKVVDVVKLGRFPDRSMFSGWTNEAAEHAGIRSHPAAVADDEMAAYCFH
ncbi:ABC-type cobalamin/Fe3+-siderophores transport system ATPase subunit [Rhizobium sp. BK049]|nr:ABC-type cobalamin/Fe3+-siderophores transport system ATPase subunit [Rhizobium sp. BK049]